MISAPLVTMVTPSRPVGRAARASAAVILIPWTRNHVTHTPANVLNACTTQEASPAPSVNPVTMETHLPRTAGVSIVTQKLHIEHFIQIVTNSELFRIVAGCTCVTAGTLEGYCTDGVCRCDSRTGQCPCKPNIMDHNCDQCAPNHWNFGSEGGCEPCGCPHPNALSTHCNMVQYDLSSHIFGCVFIVCLLSSLPSLSSVFLLLIVQRSVSVPVRFWRQAVQ